MRFTRKLGIVVKYIPFAFYFHNRVVGSPSLHWFHKGPFVSERPKRAGANGVREKMGVTGGVGKIIFTVILV